MKTRFHFERLLFACVLFSARIFPRRAVLFAGRWFGKLAWALDARHRAIALANLSQAFPNLEEKKRRAIVLRCYEFFGTYLFEMLTLFPEFQSSRMEDFEYEGLDNLEEAYRRKKGVILCTGHFGVWELMGMAHGFKGYPMGVIARTLDNPYLQKLLDTLRRSTGNSVIDKKQGFRPMLKALKEGKGIAILIDQNVTTEDRIFVDFFGRAASTTPAVGLLKIRTDAAVLPAFALPLGKGRYRFSYGRPLEIPLTGDRKTDVLRITQEYTRAIEEQIRRYPEYWLWMHRRWKTRPLEGAESPGEYKIANF